MTSAPQVPSSRRHQIDPHGAQHLSVQGSLLMHLLEALNGRQSFGRGDRSGSGNFQSNLQHQLEDKCLQECAADYCHTTPPPKSTIALAFSPDGKQLATTHGDHTVKITCCFSRKCVRTFAQHTRTPWVVRFHPKNSDLVASGCLDGYVRIFSIASGECLRSHHFVKQLSSIAFSPDGSELAVSAGHRVYIWRYDSSSKEPPVVILKTKRTLRGLHFHPILPLLLTAELMGPRSQPSQQNTAQEPLRPAVPGPELEGIHFTDVENRLPLHMQHIDLGAERPDLNRPHNSMGGDQAFRNTTGINRQPDTGASIAASSTNSLAYAQRVTAAASQEHAGRPEDVDTRDRRATQAIPRVDTEGPGILDCQDLLPELNGAEDRNLQQPSILDRIDLNATRAFHEEREGLRHGPSDLLSTAGCRNLPMQFGLTFAEHYSQPEPSSSHEQIRIHRSADDVLNERRRHEQEGQSSENFLKSEDLGMLDRKQPPPNQRPHGLSRRSSRTSQVMTPKEYAIDKLNKPNRLLMTTSGSVSSNPAGHLEGSRPLSRGLVATTPLETALHPRLRRTRSQENLADDRLKRHAEKAARRASRRYTNLFNSQDLLSCMDLPDRLAGRDDDRLNSRHLQDSGQGQRDSREMDDTKGSASRSLRSSNDFTTARTRLAPGEPDRSAPAERLESERNEDPAEQDMAEAQHTADIVSRSHLLAAIQRQHNVIQALTGISENFEPPNPALIRIWRYEPQGTCTGSLDAQEVAISQHGAVDSGGDRQSKAQASGRGNGSQTPSQSLEDRKPPKPLTADCLRFQVGHAALCSEMGAHFSPCGKMLVLCVARKETRKDSRATEYSSKHAYELRLYGMEPQNFGQALRTRTVKAPQCLTSIQFSPTSRYLIVAYGRRHLSLLQRTRRNDQEPGVYTIMELWKVADLTLVQTLPEAVDEINTAAWSPIPGGGLAYGTKEGCVRMLAHPGAYLSPATGKLSPRLSDLDEMRSEASTDTDLQSGS